MCMRSEFLNLKIPLPIAVIGLGISGNSALELLLCLGVPRNQISTFDSKAPADFKDPELLLETAGPRSFCVSPGVPLSTDWIASALGAGVRITSELEISFSFLTSEMVIGITGSVGKSTTTSLLGAGALAVDPHTFVGGNLGTPLAQYVIDLLAKHRQRAELVLLELSSYQLENFSNLRSDISLLTFLSPNHMERYPSLEKYYASKLSLFDRTQKFAVLNKAGGAAASKLQEIQSKNPILEVSIADRESSQFKFRLVHKPALVGLHNQDNLAMAFLVADKLHWPQASYEAMLSFPGLPHRLESLGRHKNILFLNDSKATTIDSVLQAVASIQSEFAGSKIHLLLGGRDKNLPWQNLSTLGQSADLSFSFFGEFAAGAQAKSRLAGNSFQDLKSCLRDYRTWISHRDVVLFSPGGTSHDEFKNFEERGLYFKRWVLSEFQNG